MPNNTELDYVDVREFFYKYFDADLSLVGSISIILQLAIVIWLAYEIYVRIRDTQAERVIRGLVLLMPLVLLCYIFKLTLLTRLIELLSSTILIGLIVIFAPEFRRVLMHLGSEGTVISRISAPESKQNLNSATEELIDALTEMQAVHTGAIIVLEKNKVDRFYVNPGHEIQAKLSKELLLTIFSPKSPLHDGAVTVRGSMIEAAGVLLPMTENPKLDWQYGTRHRAAIGFTEITESLCLVVSEETGDISVASQGKLVRCPSIADLRVHIKDFYAALDKAR